MRYKSDNQNTAYVEDVAAPTGGWNAISPLADMPRTDAIFLDNFWPTPTDCKLRKGWQVFGNVPEDNPAVQAHDIRTLMSYQSPTGTAKLFACDQTGIYDITAGGSIAVASSVCTNGEWQYVNITTSGGSYLWCCNGVDKSRIYNGSAWTLLDGVSTPALTGVTSTDISNVHLFKSRLYLTIKNTLNFAYLGVNSIAGAASVFELGSVFKRGGHLMIIDSWTFDGGEGIDDYMVFITSEGEVALYKGYDPSNAANWALAGVYYIGEPMSKRATAKVGGDLLILTVQGVFPLSKALGYATIDKSIALDYKIQPIFLDYARLTHGTFGWQILLYPALSMVIINVPYKVSASSNYLYSYQLVMNATNKSWARFTNMTGECFAVHDNNLYFASHNVVYKGWSGDLDGTRPVIGKAKQAFTKLGRRSGNKHVKMIRPIFQGNTEIKASLGFDVDFQTGVPLSSSVMSERAVSLFDSGIYDQSLWSGSTVTADWTSISNEPGMWFSLNMKIESKVPNISWVGTEYLIEKAGII